MASTTLNKTYSANATNGNKSTFSCWVKRGKLGTRQMIFDAYDGGAGGQNLEFEATTDVLSYNNTEGDNDTSMVFRDTSAWYHIVLAVDTTQGSASTQVKIYVNGVQQSLGVNTGASAVSQFGKNGVTARIGSNNGGTNHYFDGSMSHFHFIDGTAYDASAFGEYDANGVWTINTSPSVTYGTNGFFILKNGNSVTDQSPNTNNFTVGGGTLTNTLDCPDNVFCTMNPLDNYYQGSTFSNGNNTVVSGSSSTTFNTSTLMMTSGKYYVEVKPTAGSATSQIGVTGRLAVNATSTLAVTTSAVGYLDSGSVWGSNSNQGGTWSTYSNNDIIGIALDLDNNKLYFRKNGEAWGNSGDPTSGATGTGAVSIVDPASTTLGAYAFAMNETWNDNTRTWQWNFGNGYFGTTAVSDAGINASGIGIFEYDVPTGYTALSTKGLNL